MIFTANTTLFLAIFPDLGHHRLLVVVERAIEHRHLAVLDDPDFLAHTRDEVLVVTHQQYATVVRL